MEDHHLLLQPFVTTTTSSSALSIDNNDTTLPASSILYRLFSVFFIAIISIWANHEASKGFDINIINDAGNTPAARRFNLFFISNDKATRIVLKTSEFAENILYPDNYHPKKPINLITVKLTDRNLTHSVIVTSSEKQKSEFVLHVSSSVMEENKVEKAIESAIQRGMARVWLWDGEDYGAPVSLIDGLVEYVAMSAGFVSFSGEGGRNLTLGLPGSDTVCWEDKDYVGVAKFLKYCEGMRKGFVARLISALRDPWQVLMVDEALGLPAQQLCAAYHESGLRRLVS